MITTPVTPATPTAPHPLPPVAAGVALLAFPLLLAAGLWFSPEQASDSTRDYVASLGVAPARTALSAGLLHYAWVAFALGVLGTIGLVSGRRGPGRRAGRGGPRHVQRAADLRPARVRLVQRRAGESAAGRPGRRYLRDRDARPLDDDLVGAAPMAVVGARLLTRASARVRAQEV